MHQLRSVQSWLQYIPDVWEEPIKEEMLMLYEMASAMGIPCLDSDILKPLHFYHLAICFYHHFGGEVLGSEWYEDPEKWKDLNELFPYHDYEQHYLRLREDVRIMMNQYGLFYEDNWLYALYPTNYRTSFENQPLQSIW
jgi:hypothetical protein